MFLSFLSLQYQNETITNNLKLAIMTTEKLIALFKEEVSKSGKYIYTDRRKTIEEMLRMKGISISDLLNAIVD